MTLRRPAAALAAFPGARAGASAVEFALVAMPFVMLLLGLPQMAVYYMTQTSLDTGVLRAGDSIVNVFYSGTTPTAVTPSTLKAFVVAQSGGMIHDDATLSVDLVKLSSLGAAHVPVGNTIETTAPRDVMVLRAKATVMSVVPLMGSLSVQSSVIVRRQGL